MKMKTFSQTLQEMKNPAMNKSPSTIKIYRRTLLDYEKFLVGRTPTVENAEEYLSSMTIQKSTYNTYASALRNYFKISKIKIPEGSLKLITKKNLGNIRADKYVTFKQVNEIVDILDNLQEHVIIRLLYHSGVRSGSEFTSLNVEDVDFKKAKIKVKGSKKSKKIRVVNLIEPDYVMPLLKRYLKQRGINPDKLSRDDMKQPLVVTRGKNAGSRVTWSTVRGLCMKIRRLYPELSDLSAHWFRHGFAVWSKIDGMPVDLCAIQLGNEPQTCAEIYSHFSELDVDRYFKEREQTKEETGEYVDPLSEVSILRDEIKKMKEDMVLVKKYYEEKAKG